MELKSIDIYELYKLLVSAKLVKLSDGGQIKLIKACNELKKTALALEEFEKDARDKLRDDKFTEMVNKATQWQREGQDTTLTEDERREINMYFAEYENNIKQCMEDEYNKLVTVKIDKLSDEAFEQFTAANDFDVQQAMKLAEFLI